MLILLIFCINVNINHFVIDLKFDDPLILSLLEEERIAFLSSFEGCRRLHIPIVFAKYAVDKIIFMSQIVIPLFLNNLQENII